VKPVKIFIAILCILFSAYGLAGAADNNWAEVAGKIDTVLMGALQTYEKGKAEQGMEEVADVYFGVFEGEDANMEIAVRRFVSVKKSRLLERAFTDIRRDMHNKAALPAIKVKVLALIDLVNKVAKELDRKGVPLDAGFK